MLDISATIIKALFYISALGVIGLAIHRALSLHISMIAIRALAILFLGCAILRLIGLNAEASGSWANALSGDTFRWIWLANAKQIYAFALGTGFVLLSSLFKSPKISRIGAGIGALIIAIGFGLAGHAQGLENPGIFPLLTITHVFIAGFWFIAPVTLYPRARITPDLLTERVKRFSQFAIWLVPILFLTGLWLLWRIGGPLSEILSSNYGRILLMKLLAATILLSLGAYNKMTVTRLLEEQHAIGRKKLTTTLKLEAVFFLIVVGLIASATTVFGPTH